MFKHRKLTGDEAEWVVLPVVHEAVEVLKRINNDPDLLFGYWGAPRNSALMLSGLYKGLRKFRDHLNDLFGTPEDPFIPLTATAVARPGPSSEAAHDEAAEDDAPQEEAMERITAWAFETRQFRRTLAWYIAHRPFGVVAGSLQYKHARLTVFEGYADTSASGFAAEVQAEEAIARLDLLEDLYRDWLHGARTGGAAAPRIDAEFERIRHELGDLPGLVADPVRLRVMLEHLAKILHPGMLSDCFFQPTTALCLTHRTDRPAVAAAPAPATNMCLRCPNARRTARHQPRLELALAQARTLLPDPRARSGAQQIPPLQKAALDTYTGLLERALAEITDPKEYP
ncbi:hypothetical protein ACFC1R_36660 [Kitasatospora sp. NPDC056138]|uniref:hypothetical protein n=1 Tax=Kitasatospora sp. NPDC056138 TaxID=3345724 RepID=UPI0035E0BAA0